MLATDVLRSEHRVIEQVLDCLAKLVDDCADEGKLDGDVARQIIDFFQTFADQCHHFKEESRLFPLLESKGFRRPLGPTEMLCAEHHLGRRFLQGMDEAINGAARGEADVVERFVNFARAYCGLMREHIKKEDTRLFPMANEALTDDDQQRLLKAFDEVENQKTHAATHEKYLRLADELADRLGVPRAKQSSLVAPLCCGHAAGMTQAHCL